MKITIGAPRVLGIELDNGIARVVEMEFKSKTPKIYNAFTVPAPKNIITQEGLVQESEEFRTAFLDTLSRLKISADHIAFSISSSRIINREITIPMVKESKIETLLYQNASDYFPINISDYKLIYNILGKFEENGKRLYKLLVCAVPRDIIRSYYRLANFLGMNIAAIDFAGNGIFQALKVSAKEVLKDTVSTDKTELYVAAYSEHSILTFVKEGTICLQRVIAVGLSGVNDYLMPDTEEESAFAAERPPYATEEPSYATDEPSYAAEEPSPDEEKPSPVTLDRILRNLEDDICYSSLRRAEDPAMAGEKASCTKALRSLVLSIRRSVEYYVSTTQASQIEVYLVGGTVLYRGLNDLLASELDLPVVTLESDLERKYPSIGDGFDFTAVEFLAPIGACTQPINLANRQQAKSVSAMDVFNDHSVQNTLLAIGLVCFLICGAIAVALAMMGTSDRDAIVSREAAMQNELILMGDTTAAKKTYENAKLIFDSLKNGVGSMENYMETYNDHFVEFIVELERKMPKEFRVMGISVTDKGVTMNVRVNTKEQAAYVIQTLRNCASVTMGTPSTITITQDTQVTGYNIDALLTADGHLTRENLATKYANYTQAELDNLIPLLQSGMLSPAEVYSIFTEKTYIEYTVDEEVLSMIELYKQFTDNPLAQRADTMIDAMLKYLNTAQLEDLSVLDSFEYVNNNIFRLTDFGITDAQYNGYLETMRSYGYDWETIFRKNVRTEYEEIGGSGIELPKETVDTEILSFTIALEYTGKFEPLPEEESDDTIELSDDSAEESVAN